MKLLEKSEYPYVQAKYKVYPKHFPLIAMVLSGVQDGQVYWDGVSQNYFVIHSFGFCQLLEFQANEDFDVRFANQILINKAFTTNKLRWYDVAKKWQTWINQQDNDAFVLVDRTQMLIDKAQVIPSTTLSYQEPLSVKLIDELNFELIEDQTNLGLASRFWNSKASFLQNSFGTVVFKDERVISVCYACAIANERAEIDIFTVEKYRGKGHGDIALRHFVEECKVRRLSPNWDCYTNNLPSFNLAVKFGFKSQLLYSHAIIDKQARDC